MLPFDPLTKTNIFHSELVTRHLAANFFLVGFATTLVVLRFITRRICGTKIWWDDFAAVVSLIFTIGMLAMHITDANYGMGYQTKELPIANSIFLAKLLIAYQAVYYAAVSSVKLSYLLFYLRFFTLKEHRIWVWICMGLVVAYWLGSMLATFLLCTPLEANWNPLLARKYCPDHKHSTAFVATGIFNMITDLIIILLPIPFIRKLQMTRGAKIGLVAIFAIGLLVTAISILRIAVIFDLLHTAGNTKNLPYAMTDAAFWSVAEPAVAIINCCIMTLRPLLRLISPTRLWSSNRVSPSDEVSHPATIGGGSKLRNKIGDEHDEYPITLLEDGNVDTEIGRVDSGACRGIHGYAGSEKSGGSMPTVNDVSNYLGRD